jgi:hypothetical protein
VKKQKLTTYLPPEMIKALKIQAIEERVTANIIIEKALNVYLKKEKEN